MRFATALVCCVLVACGKPAPPLRPVTLPPLASVPPATRQSIEAEFARQIAVASNATAPAEQRATAFQAIGKLFIAARYDDGAEAALLNAVDLAGDDPASRYYLSEVYRMRGHPDKAVTHLEAALARMPGNVPALTRLGEAYLALGKPDLAQQPLTAAVALEPRNPAVNAGLGRAALARGDNVRAITFFETALAADPSATSLEYPLSLAYRHLGDVTTADDHLRRRGQQEPVFVDPLMDAAAAVLPTAAAYDATARTAILGGDWPAAIQAAQRGLELSAPQSTVRASLEIRLGTAFSQVGRAGDARAAFERAILAQPSLPDAHYSLAVLLLGTGEFAAAVEHLQTALTVQPDYVDGHVLLGDVLRQRGQAAAAVQHYQAALGTAPQNTAAAFGQILSLVKLRRLDEAREAASRSATSHPGNQAFEALLEQLRSSPGRIDTNSLYDGPR